MEKVKTILVVDDHREIVKLLEHILTTNGYETIFAYDGENALYVCQDYPFPIHLLLTDIHMEPNMDGCELAATMRILRPEIKVIYMSAYTEDERVFREVRAGMADFLPKPFSQKELLKKVEDMLGVKSLSKSS